MNKIIFSGYGIDIIERDGCFFILYDAGGLFINEQEIEVTSDEALKAQKSEQDAYEVILSAQSRRSNGAS